jgi:hypothetical protein
MSCGLLAEWEKIFLRRIFLKILGFLEHIVKSANEYALGARIFIGPSSVGGPTFKASSKNNCFWQQWPGQEVSEKRFGYSHSTRNMNF